MSTLAGVLEMRFVVWSNCVPATGVATGTAAGHDASALPAI